MVSPPSQIVPQLGPLSTHLAIDNTVQWTSTEPPSPTLQTVCALETALRDSTLTGQRYRPLSYYAAHQPQSHSIIKSHSMGVKRSLRDSVSSSEDSSTPYLREQSVDSKIAHVDAESAVSDQAAVMRCSLPPHKPLSFTSFEDYEVHYQKTHVNRCSECQKNFPDDHLLLLHIAEYHDPIAAEKRDQGEKTVGHMS